MAEQNKQLSEEELALAEKVKAGTASEAEKAKAKSFDELLAEWPGGDDDDQAEEKAESKAKPNGKGKDAADFDPVEFKAFMEEFRADKQKREVIETELEADRTDRNQKKFVKDIKAAVDDLKDADGEVILGLALVEFNRSPELMRAWEERGKKPKQWREVVEALGKKIAPRIPKAAAKSDEDEEAADDKNTDDANRRLAARAAGRTTTTSRKQDSLKEEDEKALAMNPREFADHVFKTTRTRI